MKYPEITLTFAFLIVLVLAIYFVVPNNTPSTHQAIVDDIEIVDTEINMKLEPKLVSSGTLEYGKTPELSTFTTGKQYPQTTWVWQRFGDTEWCMTIWGPGDDGETYFVEFGRLSSHSFIIYYQGKAIFDVSTCQPEQVGTGAYKTEGYYIMYVSRSEQP